MHTVINCVQVQNLPTAQVTPALTDSFSWGHDPFTHACKARPLTVVGWTSLSVIVIVMLAAFVAMDLEHVVARGSVVLGGG